MGISSDLLNWFVDYCEKSEGESLGAEPMTYGEIAPIEVNASTTVAELAELEYERIKMLQEEDAELVKLRAVVDMVNMHISRISGQKTKRIMEQHNWRSSLDRTVVNLQPKGEQL